MQMDGPTHRSWALTARSMRLQRFRLISEVLLPCRHGGRTRVFVTLAV
jgi:hypothetical protein